MCVAMIALICFLAGSDRAHDDRARADQGGESSILSKARAYEYLKQEGASALGVATMTEHPVVLVETDVGWQIGVQTEMSSGGLATVFLPGAPNPHSGSVYFVPSDRLRSAEVKLVAALSCIRRCGLGAPAHLRNFSAIASPAL
jgi:uncharacterized membrane protein